MTPTPLRFFVDPSWRIDRERPTWLAYPFWGVPPYAGSPFLRAIFAQYLPDTASYAFTDDIASAECILDPYPLADTGDRVRSVRAHAAALSRERGLPVVHDGLGDAERSAPDAGLVIRYGGYRFTRRPQDIIIPVFAEDLLESYGGGALETLGKAERPTVSFAGWTSLSAKQRLRALAKDVPHMVRGLIDPRQKAMRKGIFFREKALHVLRRSSRVDVRAVERTGFAGHVKTMEASPEEMRRDFVRTVSGCLYGLDVRGDANNTSRLFEILSLGRIPVIVDTERNFPFADVVDYDSFSLRVDFRDLAALPDIIADFHARTDEEELRAMQQRARAAFVEHFRVDAMTRGIVREIRARTSRGTAV